MDTFGCSWSLLCGLEQDVFFETVEEKVLSCNIANRDQSPKNSEHLEFASHQETQTPDYEGIFDSHHGLQRHAIYFRLE